jgi:hypothetical protein
MKHLGYLLENCSKQSNRPILSDEKLAQSLFAFETMDNTGCFAKAKSNSRNRGFS